MEPQVPAISKLSNRSIGLMIKLWIGLILVVLATSGVGWWYKQTRQSGNMPITSTDTTHEASASATQNVLNVPLLKHPAVVDISVIYTLLGSVGDINKGKLVLISKGAPLTLQLTNTTTYGQIVSTTNAIDIDQKKITKGSNVTVFVNFNPKENVTKVARVLLTPTELKSSTSGKLK